MKKESLANAGLFYFDVENRYTNWIIMLTITLSNRG